MAPSLSICMVVLLTISTVTCMFENYWRLDIGESKIFFLFSVKEVEHLDWNARMRIIMGTAYCLQYMHHDLNPPVAHSNLNSTAIYLTDDYAAKVNFLSKI